MGLAGKEGVSKATSRDGEEGEAALHPEILTPVPNRPPRVGSSVEGEGLW